MDTLHLMVTLLVTLILLTSPCAAGKNKKKTKEPDDRFYMMNFCGLTFDMDQRNMQDVKFGLTSTGRYGSNIDCHMNIVTSPGRRLSFRIEELNLHNCDDTITLYGNSDNASEALTPKMCSKARDTYRTPSSRGIIKLETDHEDHSGGFLIVVTSFYTREDLSCLAGDFQCANRICLNPVLFCNKNNNCGDKSDEPEGCNDAPWWLPIPCVIGVFALVAGFCVGKNKYDKAKRRKLEQKKKEAEAKKKKEAEAKNKKEAAEKKKKEEEKKKAEEKQKEEEKRKKEETSASNNTDESVTTVSTSTSTVSTPLTPLDMSPGYVPVHPLVDVSGTSYIPTGALSSVGIAAMTNPQPETFAQPLPLLPQQSMFTAPQNGAGSVTTEGGSEKKEPLDGSGSVWASSAPHSLTPLEPRFLPVVPAPPPYSEIPMAFLPRMQNGQPSYPPPTSNSSVVWVLPVQPGTSQSISLTPENNMTRPRST